MSGISTKNLPLRQTVDEVIGNDSQDSTVRISRAALVRLVGNSLAEQITNAGGMAIFPTTAAGLSATTDGDYFSVPSEDDDEYLTLYRNDSGSAVEVSSTASTLAIQSLRRDLSGIAMFPDVGSGLAATFDGNYFGVITEDDDEYLILYRNDDGAAEEINRVLSIEGVGQALKSVETIYETQETGESNTEDGSYFVVPTDDEYLILYRNDNGSATEVRRYPSVEGVDRKTRVAVDLASEPAREQAAFWRGEEDPVFAVVDGQGNPLFGVNDRGHFFPNAQPEGQFYRADKEAGFVIAGEDGSPLLEFSPDGWLVGGAEARPAFWTSDGQADFSVSSSDGSPLLEFDEQGELLGVPRGREAFYRDGNAQSQLFITDEQGRSLLEFDEQGNLLGVAAGEDLEGRVEALEGDFSGLEASVDSLINQGIPGLQNLPESGEGLSDGAPYSDRRTLKFAPVYSSLYNAGPSVHIPDHLALYALYDDLMSDHADYISREKLGEDALGNNIFAYHFTPPTHIEGSNYYAHPDGVPVKPLIVQVTGTHGFEKGSQYYTYVALTELCEEWKTQPLLYELRWGCDFVIVPALNPSGIDAYTRKNHNGVDLNRNFPEGFGEGDGSSDPQDNNYQGPSAGSEAETQVAMSIPTLYPNATAFIDHHMSSSYSSQGYALWIGAQSQYSRAIASTYLDEMVGYLRHEFADSNQSNIPAARLSNSIPGSITRQMDLSYPASFLFETPTGLVGPNFNTRKHNIEALKRFWRAIYDTEITRRKMSAIIGE